MTTRTRRRRPPSALITGGSRGLGLHLARSLARRGCTLTLVARDRGELDAAARTVREETGATVHVEECDVRDQERVAEVMRTTHARAGLDIVIAGAGVIQVAPVEAIGPGEFRTAMDVMYAGAMHTALAAYPYLRESRGRLALIGSVGGLLGVPHMLPYSCAKAAVATLAEGLRAEYAAAGVSVTAVHPGLMRTGSHVQAEFGGDTGAEFGWFSASAGAPLLSMDAARAAERIVRAVLRRRARLVLTPAAKTAQLAHGLAPATTTRVSTVAARLLPAADGKTNLRQGFEAGRPRHRLARRLTKWAATLNERARPRANQHRPGPRTSSTPPDDVG